MTVQRQDLELETPPVSVTGTGSTDPPGSMTETGTGAEQGAQTGTETGMGVETGAEPGTRIETGADTEAEQELERKQEQELATPMGDLSTLRDRDRK